MYHHTQLRLNLYHNLYYPLFKIWWFSHVQLRVPDNFTPLTPCFFLNMTMAEETSMKRAGEQSLVNVPYNWQIRFSHCDREHRIFLRLLLSILCVHHPHKGSNMTAADLQVLFIS